MNKNNLFKLLALLALASMVLAACGGGGGSTASTEPAVASGAKVTSTGFTCPEPNSQRK